MSDSDTTGPTTPSAAGPQGSPRDPWAGTPWTGPAGPGGTQTLPHPSSGGDPGGGSTPPPGSPWANPGPPGPPPRRRGPTGLVAAVLVGALVTGGIGGVVGYEVAATSNPAGNSVLAGSSASSPSPQAPAGSVESVAQKVLPSVVQLKGASGEGSGIVISADGLILTNAHVLEAGQSQSQQQSPFGGLGGQQEQQSAPQLSAVFQNGQTVPVQVVGTDATADLAVVRAQGVSNLTPVSLGSSSRLQVGQGVVAVGSPLGLSGTVTSGIVSALARPVATGGAQSGQATVTSAIQTDAAINPGNSGGALVDMNGQVVGITSSIASLGSGGDDSGQQSGSIGLGFAIPIDQAKRIGDELARTGSANQAVLGVGIAQSRTTDSSGAVLSSVSPGGAGANAGLRTGDVVTRLNDQVIDDGDALVAAVRAQQPGAPVTLTVATNGAAPRQVTVTLGSERAPSS